MKEIIQQKKFTVIQSQLPKTQCVTQPTTYTNQQMNKRPSATHIMKPSGSSSDMKPNILHTSINNDRIQRNSPIRDDSFLNNTIANGQLGFTKRVVHSGSVINPSTTNSQPILQKKILGVTDNSPGNDSKGNNQFYRTFHQVTPSKPIYSGQRHSHSHQIKTDYQVPVPNKFDLTLQKADLKSNLLMSGEKGVINSAEKGLSFIEYNPGKKNFSNNKNFGGVGGFSDRMQASVLKNNESEDDLTTVRTNLFSAQMYIDYQTKQNEKLLIFYTKSLKDLGSDKQIELLEKEVFFKNIL